MQIQNTSDELCPAVFLKLQHVEVNEVCSQYWPEIVMAGFPVMQLELHPDCLALFVALVQVLLPCLVNVVCFLLFELVIVLCHFEC